MAGSTVTKRNLAKAAAKAHNVTQREAAEIIQTVLERITEELGGGNRLELRNFGVFEPRLRKARPARNPWTGETLHAAARAKSLSRWESRILSP